MPTGPKVRPDASERGQEPLRVPDRRDAFPRPLAVPGRLVRVLGAGVQLLLPAMLHRRQVFVPITGAQRYLWRAVDQHGNVLDILVQSRRNAVAATKFFRRLRKGLR